MGEYAPITKELREQMAHTTMAGKPMVEMGRTVFDSHCDNIDAIHASLEQENERLRDASERGVGWIRLPVDADGVPIRVGDELTDDADSKREGIVSELCFDGARWCVCFGFGCYAAVLHKWHHAKPDTWANIINDAIVLGVEQEEGKVGLDSYSEQCDALVARCKALAGEGE